MEIEIKWLSPLSLKNGEKEGLILTCDLDEIPVKPGIYVFCRQYGNKRSPVYIGKATNLQKRIKQQLNNVRLMNGMKNSGNGKKILLLATLVPKQAQNAESVLKVLEPTLIENALTEGYNLINRQGTKAKTHSIKSSGKKGHHVPFPRRMLRKKR